MIAGRVKNTDISNTLIIKPFLVIMSVQYNLYKTGKSFIKNYLPYTSFGLSYKTRVISLSSSFRSIANIFFSLKSHFMHRRSCHFTFKTSLMNHLTTCIVQSSVTGVTPRAWMTVSTLRLIPPVRRLMSCCDSCCHSWCNAASNWLMFCTGGSRAFIRRPNLF
jgi:hypothetical protein